MSKKMYYLTMKRTAVQLNLGRTVLAGGLPEGILSSVVDRAVLEQWRPCLALAPCVRWVFLERGPVL